MRRVAVLAVIMTLALAGIAWADLPAMGKRITYAGYVYKLADGTVSADTVICVINPNNYDVTGVGIAVHDKEGVEVAQDLLIDGGTPTAVIHPHGWAWQTIGNLIPTPAVDPDYATKYTWSVYWDAPLPQQTPKRQLMVEVKEIIYKAGPTGYPPTEAWRLPYLIETWSETALGKGGLKGGLGFFPR